jgi:hypothetical protein
MSSPNAEPKQRNGFEHLEKPIQDIIFLVNKLEERYREKCFEILLQFYLHGKTPTPVSIKEEERHEKKKEDMKEEFTLPIDVRAFLQTYSIPEENISKLFLIVGNEIRPKYKITTAKKATAQIQIALLAALENALRTPANKFEFSVEDARKRCQNYKAYDSPNFKKHFKDNEKLFKSLSDEAHVELSPDGQTELAEAIVAVAK